MHIIAQEQPLQSAPYRIEDRIVVDLTFADQNGQTVKITLPFFIGISAPDEVIERHWPETKANA
jgi:hypothetical protein